MKKGIIVNQEWKYDHFNVITDNEALALEIELQNGDKVILATIYFPNGNPSLRLFRIINALSKQVIFLGTFDSKHKQFGCVKPNKSGQTLVNIAKDLKLFYVSSISQAILDLIKEKRRLRRLYNNTQDLNIKSTINRLQKEIRTKIDQESTIS